MASRRRLTLTSPGMSGATTCVDLDISRNQPVVITGLSGTGKPAWRSTRCMPRGSAVIVQLSASMSMNPDRHRNAFKDMYRYRVEGEIKKAQVIHVQCGVMATPLRRHHSQQTTPANHTSGSHQRVTPAG